MDAIPGLLVDLVRAPGASGYEEPVQAIVRREATSIGAEVTSDVHGSTTAIVRGTASGRTVALFAHADQVGMVVRGADDDGLVTVASLASWRASDAAGQRVRIVTRTGEARGVVVADWSDKLSWDDLRVDVGAVGREEALALVAPGDPVVLDGPPEQFPNGRIVSAALDDRLGIFVGLEVMRRIAADRAEWDVALVVSGQEETGTHGGARVAAARLAPDLAIVLEVTYAADAPGQEPWGDVKLGGGPTVFRGPVVSPIVGEGLLAVAEAHGIEVAIESGQSTWSDADDIFTTGAGIPCGTVCVPVRYMHTAGEVAQMSDVEAAVNLVERYVRSLRSDTSFVR